MSVVVWNPWHGCTKVSAGCLNCYVYRIDGAHGKTEASRECRTTGNYLLPLARRRDGSYRVPAGTLIYTCFTSDFFIEDADPWRAAAWECIRSRPDCHFLFFTKRILRAKDCLPDDWGDGYPNVTIGCTVENQKMADERLPVFLSLPIAHRIVGAEPLLEKITLAKYLSEGKIESVSVGGESGEGVRLCDYDWVLSLRDEARAAGVGFTFHQTGSNFCKDGRIYAIPRKEQERQARRAGIDLPPKTDV